MKVLLISSIPARKGSITGGVESATVNLLEGFIHSDIHVKVLSIRKDIGEKEAQSLGKNISLSFYPIRMIRSTKLFLALVGNRIASNLVKEYRPDIIHLQGAGTGLLLTLFLDKQKVIVTPHGILSEELKFKKELFQRLNHRLTLQIEKLFIRSIRNFIFISDYSKEAITGYHQLKVDQLTTAIIPNAVNKAFLSDPLVEKDFKRILYAGTIRRLKGLLLLIEAVNFLRLGGTEFHLDIAGDFEEEDYKTEIQQYIQKNQLSELMHFHGWIDQDRVNELMKRDPLFVLPSYQENLPMSVLEAMASGMIVIASKVGAMKELITDGVTGFLFEPGDKEQLGKILLDIVNKKVNSTRIRASARKEASDKHHPDTIAEAILSFYRKVALKD